MIDVNQQKNRFDIIQEILGAENMQRKEAALKNYEIYKDRQKQYVIEQLTKEFGAKTVQEMRVIDINLCKKIVNQMASIYTTPPTRQFVGATDAELEQIDELYEYAKVDTKLMQANRWYKLQKQAAIQIIPKDGIIEMRVLSPHQYDVIPSDEDVEKMGAVIINTVDKEKYIASFDGIDQKIADQEDYKRSQMRFIWWTDEVNFETDGNGKLTSEVVDNPIGKLPFIDVAGCSKDFEFWVREGCGPAEFSVSASCGWSDTCTINKIQGYAQAVLIGDEIPESITVGPTRLLKLPISSTSAVQPKFEFVNPNPNLSASLDLQEMLLKIFLTSEGIDPKTISGKGDSTRYSSAAERMLAMIEKFEASKEDMELFRWVEYRVFDLLKAWSNFYQGVDFLIDDLKYGQISDEVDLDINFATPQVTQTQDEKEKSVILRLDNGLISKVEAVAELRGISDQNAELILGKIREENQALVDSMGPSPATQPTPPAPNDNMTTDEETDQVDQ